MSQPNDLSFLPDDYVASRAKARANRLFGSLLLITIFSVAGAFTYAQRSLEALRKQYVAVNEDFRRESDRLKRLDTLQKQQQELSRRAKLAESLIEKSPRSEVLNEIRSALPAGTSLMEVAMGSRVRAIVKTPEQLLAEKQARKNKAKKEAEAPAIEPKLYDTTLKVVGMAYTDVQVAEYINRLSRSNYVEDVNLLVSREVTFQDQPVRRFEVEMKVRSEPRQDLQGQATLATTEVHAGQ